VGDTYCRRAEGISAPFVKDELKLRRRTSLPRKCRNRYDLTALIAVLVCTIGVPAPVLAQQGATATTKKWRPRDGLYIDADANITGPCQFEGRYLLELAKRSFIVDEAYGCRVMTIIDTAPNALRLEMACRASEITGDKAGTEIMTLRKIDDDSFVMQLSRKGKVVRPASRMNYCERLPLESLPAMQDPAAEAERKAAKDQVSGAAWRPRDGVYAIPGTDFDDRCMKSGDAVIGLAELLVSTGASRCEASKLEDSTEASIKLEARCDVKPGQTGQVPVSKNGEIVFVPVGQEKIIIANSGNQTVTLQRSRHGEFSGLGQLLAYCPDPSQRAYLESKKAK
jgi:hypothetical protein